jgi:hypothetical protein
VIGCTEATPQSEGWADGALIARPDASAVEISEFCTRMLELERRNLDQEPLLVEYRRLLPIAPDEIVIEFEALINQLTTGTLPPTSVFDPADPGPLEAVVAYVDSSCRLTAVSPLPAPTAPEDLEP